MTSFMSPMWDTLLDMDDKSIAQRRATELTEELFCGVSIEPVYVAVVEETSQGTDTFDRDICKFVMSLPRLCIDDNIGPASMWEVLNDTNIGSGIVIAVITYIRSFVAWKKSAAHDVAAEDLMTFEDKAGEVTQGAAVESSGAQPAPRFELDPATAQALVDRRAYINLTLSAYTKIMRHSHYVSFGSKILQPVFAAYEQRVAVAIGSTAVAEDGKFLSFKALKAKVFQLCSMPPHLIKFAQHVPARDSGSWSMFKSNKPGLQPGFCRLQWVSLGQHEFHIDIPERTVPAVEDALASAPKIPYFDSEWAGAVVTFAPSPWPQRPLASVWKRK